jgi:hypothetical protein
LLKLCHHYLLKYAGRIGLLLLAANVLVSSIPRCDLLLSVLSPASNHTAVEQDEHASCHEQAASAEKGGALLTNQNLCKCSLLQFLSIPVQSLNHQSHIVFNPQFLYEFAFDLRQAWSEYIPAIEPPYPKILA